MEIREAYDLPGGSSPTTGQTNADKCIFFWNPPRLRTPAKNTPTRQVRKKLGLKDPAMASSPVPSHPPKPNEISGKLLAVPELAVAAFLPTDVRISE